MNGSDLLIVDNEDKEWRVAEYLKEWCEISSAIDIATGHFEIGGLLELKGKWQSVDKIRILMGGTGTLRTAQLFRKALSDSQEQMTASLDKEKDKNPFLEGTQAIVEGLRSKKIVCRMYRKDRFHAKAFITHGRQRVVGSYAIVGSSNLSSQGLTENIELNVQLTGADVAQIQEWYEKHWNDAEDITEEMLEVIEVHTKEYRPFEVYARALMEYDRDYVLTATDWENNESKIYSQLDRLQKEGYGSLLRIANQYGGAMLCDGVGMGKTYVGLMLIERLIKHDGKRVALFAPKAVKDATWLPHLQETLPEIAPNSSRNNTFSNLLVFSHSDLDRQQEWANDFKHVADNADVIIIDEAHHFRNSKGPRDTFDWSAWTDIPRYRKMYEIAGNKQVFMLTATPINNHITDLKNMLELFTRRDDRFFHRTLGIADMGVHFADWNRKLEAVEAKHRREGKQEVVSDPADDELTDDPIFANLVVQRSRGFAKRLSILAGEDPALFPVRKEPQVAVYSVRKTYGTLLDFFCKAFENTDPLFILPMYNPNRYFIGPEDKRDKQQSHSQEQVVGLIRTQFLKRFESSVKSFERSCDVMSRKMMAFVVVNANDKEMAEFKLWLTKYSDLYNLLDQQKLDLFDDASPDDDEDASMDEDFVPEEFLNKFEKLDRNLFDVKKMIADTRSDLKLMSFLLESLSKFEVKHDDKLKQLLTLLSQKRFENQKVIIFTEFADTARYIKKALRVAGHTNVEQIDSKSSGTRKSVIERFAPYYNRKSSALLVWDKQKEIQILIATDVLSEGLNLQDATLLINYDIHWNPVRLMQRIGRVDRRLNKTTEAKMVADHPHMKSVRGKIQFWNFLPPDELNQILSLYSRVTQKTLLISKTQGIEERQLLTPDDDYDALKEFNALYEGNGTKRSVAENIRAEYLELQQDDPELVNKLNALPGQVFSGRVSVSTGMVGAFFCYRLPAWCDTKQDYTLDVGTTRWYFCPLTGNNVVEDVGTIYKSVKTEKRIERVCTIPRPRLIEMRKVVQNHVKNTYLASVNAPVNVKAKLVCWMELGE